MKTQAKYPYQERVAAFTRDKPRVGIITFYGSGKTYMSLRWLESLHLAHRNIFPCLVLTKKSLIAQWGTEIDKHAGLVYSLVRGTAKERVEALHRPADIYVLNYDAIQSPPVLRALGVEKKRTATGRLTFKRAGGKFFGSVIVDESTELKDSTTQRFKALYCVLQTIPFRAILTGRMLTEEPMEVWPQMYILDDGKLFYRSFWKFRCEYFCPGPPWKPYDWTLKDRAAERIAQGVSNLCIRISKNEIIDQLPPREFVTIPFDMPESVREIYKKMKKEFACSLPSGAEFETKWAITQTTKLHQLCQGFMYHGEDKWDVLHLLKLEWLEENIKEILKIGPTLIWAPFRAQQHLVRVTLASLGIPFGVVIGEIPAEERDWHVTAFQAGNFDVLLLSQMAGGAGLNLQRACNAIYMANSYSADDRENSLERCHRLGSEGHKCVTYYDLVMKDSIDEAVLKALQSKHDIADSILQHIRKE